MRESALVRRALAASAALVLTLSSLTVGATAAHAAPQPSSVAQMAALGDSITRATMTCSTLSGCPANSWATGDSTTVNSHYLRLKALGAPVSSPSNLAVNGATSRALFDQASSAAAQGAQYVTIEIGANDACTSTVSAMTPTDEFRANVHAAIYALATSSSSPEIFVASVPNLLHLYELFKKNATARATWTALQICQSLLANPSSTKPADVQRRLAVQQRVNEYNTALHEVCAAVTQCRFDGFEVANYKFIKSEVSTRDYFHPSISGQAKLASLTWQKTQWVSP